MHLHVLLGLLHCKTAAPLFCSSGLCFGQVHRHHRADQKRALWHWVRHANDLCPSPGHMGEHLCHVCGNLYDGDAGTNRLWQLQNSLEVSHRPVLLAGVLLQGYVCQCGGPTAQLGQHDQWHHDEHSRPHGWKSGHWGPHWRRHPKGN